MTYSSFQKESKMSENDLTIKNTSITRTYASKKENVVINITSLNGKFERGNIIIIDSSSIIHTYRELEVIIGLLHQAYEDILLENQC